VQEVFEKLGSHVLIRWPSQGNFAGYPEHVKCVHRHPARSVGLFDVSTHRQWLAAVKHPDVVEPEETAPKTLLPADVFSVYPPRKVEQ
jgi:hypothetical protein